MNNISFFFIFLLLILNSCRAIKPAAEVNPVASQTILPNTAINTSAVNFSDQTTWLLGYFNPDRLTIKPHSMWFNEEYNDYQANKEVMLRLREINKDSLSIKIVLGTWCPDSRREVPRFMRVLDIWELPYTMLTFIGVDNAKLSPVGEYEKLTIQRVPTFIIYKNNVETGRIIENPVTSLEQDIVNILTGVKNNK